MKKIGMDNGMFKPCPESPNCVSTMEKDKEHTIAPLVYAGNRDAARTALIILLKGYAGCRIEQSRDEYIHCIFTTKIMRFKDDVEFFFPADENIIHMRSASRIGYSDMGVNRKRMEKIRADFKKVTAQ